MDELPPRLPMLLALNSHRCRGRIWPRGARRVIYQKTACISNPSEAELSKARGDLSALRFFQSFLPGAELGWTETAATRMELSNLRLMTALHVYEVTSGVFAHIAVRIPDIHAIDTVTGHESRFQVRVVGANKAV